MTRIKCFKPLLAVGLFLVVTLLFSSHTAYATNPSLISFQGKVVNADGTNVSNGTYNFDFVLYDDPTLGTPSDGVHDKWHELSKSVTVTNGVFQTNLGSATALPDFNANPSLYLAVRFNADAAGYMSPRIQLASVPYALNTDKLGGLSSASFGQLAANQTWTGTNTVQPTTNITGEVVKQTSVASPTADIFDVQTANSTSVIQVTGPSANNAAVSITSVGGSSGLTLQAGSGTVSFGTSTNLNSTNGLTVTGGSTLTLNSTGTNAVSLDSGTTGSVLIGTGTGSAKTIQIGPNATNTNTTTIQVGANAAGPQSIAIGSTGSGVTANASSTVSIQAGTGPNAISIGTTTAVNQVTIGSTNGVSNTTIQSGSGNINLITNNASSGVIIQANTDSATALQVQSGDTTPIFNVNTTDTNSLANLDPGFESNPLTSWVGKGTGSIARSTAQTYTGNASGAITTLATANTGVQLPFTFSPSTQYTFSVYARLSSGTMSTLSIGRQDVSGTDIDCLTAQIVSATGWTRYVCTFTTGGTITSSNLYLKQSDALARSGTLFIDSAQLETSASATPYGDGSIQSDAVITSPIAIQNAADSTTEFQIQNASSSTVFNVDTTNSNITIGGNNSATLAGWNTSPVVIPASGSATEGTPVTANGYAYLLGGDGNLASTTVRYVRLNANGTTPAAGQPGTWNTTTAMPVAIRFEQAVSLNGYMYTLGGSLASGRTSSVYYAKENLDGTLGTWIQTSSFPLGANGLSSGAAAVYNGYIYEFGGYTNPGPVSTGNVYYAKANADGTIGAWQTSSNPISGTALGTIEGTSAAVGNGYVYITGGYNGTFQSSVYYAKFNTTTGDIGAWTLNGTSPTSPIPGEGNAATVLNGYLYIIGGNNAGGRVSATSYAPLNGDGSVGTWASGPSLPTAEGPNNVLNVNGYLYIMGGEGVGGINTVVYTTSPRVQIGGSVDLIGLGGEDLAEGGSGGTLTAGDTTIVGTLQVQDQTSLAGGLSVGGTLAVAGATTIKNVANSIAAFQVQNATGTDIFTVDTTNGKAGTEDQSAASTASANLVLQSGNASGTTSNSGSVSLDSGTATGTAGNVLIGAGTTSAKTIQIGPNATNTNTTTYQFGTNAAGTQAIAIGSTGTGVTANANTTVSIQAGTAANAISIGTTSAAVNQVLIGSVNAGSTATIQGGSGNGVQLQSQGTILIANNAANQTVTIGASGSAANTSAINLGTSTGATQTVNAGSTNSGSSVNFTAGGVTQKLTNNSDIIQSTTNSAAAFQVQDASGAAVLLVDTTSTAANGTQVNYLTYPGFESGSLSNASAGWAPVASSTLTQNTNKAHTYNGLFSAQVVNTLANQGLTTSSFISAPATGNYIVSFYAEVSTGTMAGNLFAVQSTDGATHSCNPSVSVTVNSTGFQRLSCTLPTTTGTMTALQITQTDATSRTIYIDSVQLQSTTFNGGAITAPTPYQIGGIQLRGVIQNPVTILPNADSTSVFQIFNAAGTNVLLNADTLDSTVSLGTIGSTALASTVNIANTSGNATQTVNIGSTGSASNAVLIQGGTGGTAVSLQTGAAGTVLISTTAQNSSVQIGTIATNTSNTQTIGIGNTTAAGTTNVTIGAFTGATAGNTTIQAFGTIALQAATGGTINVGANTLSNTIQIGTASTNTGNTQTIGIGNLAAAGTTNVAIGCSTACTAGTTAIKSFSTLTITAGTASTWSTAAGALTLTSAAATTWSTGAGLLTITGAGGTTITGNTGVLTVGNTALTGLGLNLLSTTYAAATRGVTIGTADANITLLDLDQSTTAAAETAANCTTAINPGGLYFATGANTNAGTNGIRGCINGKFQDIISSDQLGVLLVGVVPDSGSANQGDMSNTSTGPCKTSWASATTVSVAQCVAYSGGRKVVLTAATTVTMPATTTGQFVHVCFTNGGTAGTPVSLTASAAGAETANVPAFSATNPILCIADVKASGTNTIGNIYDTRVFTNTIKQFTTMGSATAVTAGMVVIINGTNGVNTVAGAATAAVRGVVAVGNSTGSTGSQIIIATGGPAFAKTTGTITVGQAAQTSGTAGYIQSAASVGGYKDIGQIIDTVSTTCTSSADCQFSTLVDLGAH